MITVIGIDKINPGIPQINPQSINITKIVITFIEKVFPIKTGSKTLPKITCTPVIVKTKNNKVLITSISTKANIDSKTIETIEPII